MKPISILIVDDNATFLRIAARFLQQSGDVVVVGTARNGHEALAQAQTLNPQVVLMDLAMPGLPGLQAIPHLRARLPEVSVIVLTLLDANSYRSAALAAGADGFVSKAALNTDLIPLIRRIVGNADRGARHDEERASPAGQGGTRGGS